MKTIQSKADFEQILVDSKDKKILLCKFSPICPTSFMVQRDMEVFMKSNKTLPVYTIDVVKQRALSREIADITGIRHESPQALLFESSQVVWDASHYAFSKEALIKKL